MQAASCTRLARGVVGLQGLAIESQDFKPRFGDLVIY